jgi:glycosyltransferase involved in cell wall biosynthesis
MSSTWPFSSGLLKTFPSPDSCSSVNATCSMERLTALPNVTWAPRRPYEHIPAYGRALGVALMPWLQNDGLRSCNPIKLKEYLALGLPVVSTDLPEVHHFADVVRGAHSPDEFVALMRRSLDDGGPASPAARRAAVTDASWDTVATRLEGVCDAVRSRSCADRQAG